jgi:hypothetical protein
MNLERLTAAFVVFEAYGPTSMHCQNSYSLLLHSTKDEQPVHRQKEIE